MILKKKRKKEKKKKSYSGGWQNVPREDHVVGAVTAVELESLLSLISPNDAAEKCSGAVLNSFIYQNQGKFFKTPG